LKDRVITLFYIHFNILIFAFICVFLRSLTYNPFGDILTDRFMVIFNLTYAIFQISFEVWRSVYISEIKWYTSIYPIIFFFLNFISFTIQYYVFLVIFHLYFIFELNRYQKYRKMNHMSERFSSDEKKKIFFSGCIIALFIIILIILKYYNFDL